MDNRGGKLIQPPGAGSRNHSTLGSDAPFVGLRYNHGHTPWEGMSPVADEGQAGHEELLQEVRDLADEARRAPDLSTLKSVFYRIQAVGQQEPEDRSLQAAVAEAKQAVVVRGNSLRAGTGQNPVQQAVATPPQHAVPTPAELRAASAPAPTPSGLRPLSGPNPTAHPIHLPHTPAMRNALNQGRTAAFDWKQALLTGAAIALALFAAGLFFLRERQRKDLPVPPASAGVVAITTKPPGASILINGRPRGKSDANIELPPGQYEIQALLDGYEPAVRRIALTPGARLPVDEVLTVASQSVRVAADLEAGTVTLDSTVADMQGGQAVLENVSPGSHSLKISGRGGDAIIPFETAVGAMPKLTQPPKIRNFVAIIVSNLGGRAYIAGNTAQPVKVSLDDREVGEVGPNGLDLKDISPGDHTLTWGDGPNARKVIVRFGPNPSLNAFLKLDINAGTLVVLTGEDKARVVLDGREIRRESQHGQLRLPMLPVHEYNVTVVKEGFEPVPPKKVMIRKGEEAKVEFHLKPLPKVASLHLTNATPGAMVLLDGVSIGEIETDGAFSRANIAPGEHVLELRRDGRAPKRFKKQFEAGTTVEIAGTDVVLEAAQGTVHISVTPPDAKISYKRYGSSQAQTLVGKSVSLPVGSYSFTARAPNHSERTESVQVNLGETARVNIVLTPEHLVQPTTPVPVGMAAFESPGSWTKDDDWYTRKGGGLALLKSSTTAGAITFSARVVKTGLLKKNPLQWVLRCKGPQDYSLFQLDRKGLVHREVTAGKSREIERASFPNELPSPYSVQIEVQPHVVIHRIRVNDEWKTLLPVRDASADFTDGKFGFLVAGSDEIGVASFLYRPAAQ